jgi:hypothetical protein
MIRLMAIGTNRGENHREALKRLAPDHNTSHDCYIVPMLTEIVYNDMIFAVFPMMSKGFSNPWYYQLSEVFDAVGQVLEVRVPGHLGICHFSSSSSCLDDRLSISAMSDWSHTEYASHLNLLVDHS